MMAIKQPCSARCMHHHSHPCENCGRQWGNVVPLKQQIKELKAQVKQLQDYKREQEQSELIEAHKLDKAEAQVEECMTMLDNVKYWDTCLDDYIERIEKLKAKERGDG